MDAYHAKKAEAIIKFIELQSTTIVLKSAKTADFRMILSL